MYGSRACEEIVSSCSISKLVVSCLPGGYVGRGHDTPSALRAVSRTSRSRGRSIFRVEREATADMMMMMLEDSEMARARLTALVDDNC